MELFNNELYKYSTDLDFYICNIFYWKQKLISLGFNFNLPIDNDPLLKEQCLDMANRVFTSGPIFPILLGLTILAGSTKYLTIFYLFLLGLFFILARKITFLKKKSSINFLSIVLIICPSIFWVALYPSTDLLSSVFWLSALYTFKKYIFYKSTLFKNKNFDKPNYYFFIFSGFLLLTLLTRPLTILILLTCLAWLLFEIIFIKNIEEIPQSYTSNRFKGFRFNQLYPILGLIIIVLTIHFSLYSQYGTNSKTNLAHIFFWAFSPPAPLGLQETIKIHLDQIKDNYLLINNSLIQVSSLILKSLILLINQLVYGVLSLSGIQFKFPITLDNVISLRVIAATYKSLFGIIIILPSIYSLFSSFVRTNKRIYFLKLINLKNPEKIYGSILQILTILHIFTCLIFIPHIRYLTPIIPILISNFINKYSTFKELQK